MVALGGQKMISIVAVVGNQNCQQTHEDVEEICASATIATISEIHLSSERGNMTINKVTLLAKNCVV